LEESVRADLAGQVLEALIAKGRRARRPREQKEVAFGLADLSTHRECALSFF
jgi:hypothetical protein